MTILQSVISQTSNDFIGTVTQNIFGYSHKGIMIISILCGGTEEELVI